MIELHLIDGREIAVVESSIAAVAVSPVGKTVARRYAYVYIMGATILEVLETKAEVLELMRESSVPYGIQALKGSQAESKGAN